MIGHDLGGVAAFDIKYRFALPRLIVGIDGYNRLPKRFPVLIQRLNDEKTHPIHTGMLLGGP